MKTISLTRGFSATVDDEDYDYLSKWNWYAVTFKNNSKVYAARNPGRAGCSKYFLMHRVVMNAKDGEMVDHKDRNGLNNTKSNLRFCDSSKNLQNVGISKNNRSGFKGVAWHSKAKKWRARILVNGKDVHLGLFDSVDDALNAYDSTVTVCRGEFSVTNKSLNLNVS